MKRRARTSFQRFIIQSHQNTLTNGMREALLKSGTESQIMSQSVLTYRPQSEEKNG